MRGGVAARHCKPDAMKHVLPRFLRPHTPGHAAESMTQITHMPKGAPATAICVFTEEIKRTFYF
jgi:hypothetical protein